MLYTGKGDKGETSSLFSSKKRISKSSSQTEALGAVDEVNSLLGLCKAGAKRLTFKVDGQGVSQIIEGVQQDLFVIQAVLADAPKELGEDRVRRLEEIIASIEADLPEIKSFFLAGATELSGLLDYARSVARRAERRVVERAGEIDLPPTTLSYMNRLSSLLYALVRIVNLKTGAEETPPSY